MLIGNDVKLNSPSSLIGQALAEILQYPDRARDALRVLLHLVRYGTLRTMKMEHRHHPNVQFFLLFAGGEVSAENTEWPA